MKLVVAIIRPDKLGYVTSALRRAGVSGATVTTAKGFGQENVEADWDLSGELTDKVKVEIVLNDGSCDEIVSLLEKTIDISKVGAGFIYVQEVLTSFGFQNFSGEKHP